jgi:hypothetical protein
MTDFTVFFHTMHDYALQYAHAHKYTEQQKIWGGGGGGGGIVVTS